jgi:hypothetical protein
MSIEKEFVSYNESLELKELGFDEKCFKCKVIGQEHFDYTPSDYDDFPEQNEKEILIPTFSQAFRWFRENHGLECCLKINSDILNSRIMYLNGKEVCRFIIKDKKWELMDRDDEAYKKNSAYYEKTYTYEEAELACLKKLIQIVKNENK